jgi:hypothetical protein
LQNVLLWTVEEVSERVVELHKVVADRSGVDEMVVQLRDPLVCLSAI